VVVAPETSHAVKAAIDIALQCKEKNEEKVILFNLSGHGLLDLKAYEDKLSGKLVDYAPDEAMLKNALASIPTV
jgi:tryptophan synthase beta chain